ncbi:MAG: M23 family metallopeptidase [Clostridia bacterium]
MENEKKSDVFKSVKTFLKANVVYVILIACLIVTGVTAVIVFSGNKGDDGKNVNNSGDESIVAAMSATPKMPTPTQLATVIPTPCAPIPNLTPNASPNRTSAKKLLSAPVKGDIIWGYAENELIYSKTLNQWMTHSGVDIGAKEGTNVVAVADGIVKSVLKDDALGTTIIIQHSNGDTTLYASLSENFPVKEGVSVKQGTVIGTVGNSALSECLLKSHLHFEYRVKNVPVDPSLYVLFLKG